MEKTYQKGVLGKENNMKMIEVMAWLGIELISLMKILGWWSKREIERKWEKNDKGRRKEEWGLILLLLERFSGISNRSFGLKDGTWKLMKNAGLRVIGSQWVLNKKVRKIGLSTQRTQNWWIQTLRKTPHNFLKIANYPPSSTKLTLDRTKTSRTLTQH